MLHKLCIKILILSHYYALVIFMDLCFSLLEIIEIVFSFMVV